MAELTSQEIIDQRRSLVRVIVTYGAAIFIFLITPILIGILIWREKHDQAINLFNIIVPIATGVISFWFANRSGTKKPD